jgi:hypothetical protein
MDTFLAPSDAASIMLMVSATSSTTHSRPTRSPGYSTPQPPAVQVGWVGGWVGGWVKGLRGWVHAGPDVNSVHVAHG